NETIYCRITGNPAFLKRFAAGEFRFLLHRKMNRSSLAVFHIFCNEKNNGRREDGGGHCSLF
ncbi:MAG: hypothetical protein UHG68_11575, partial [Clostridia bacterium]|nr:hypothetical protein [Clostridia bacterium]